MKKIAAIALALLTFVGVACSSSKETTATKSDEQISQEVAEKTYNDNVQKARDALVEEYNKSKDKSDKTDALINMQVEGRMQSENLYNYVSIFREQGGLDADELSLLSKYANHLSYFEKAENMDDIKMLLDEFLEMTK